jgi:uncharacterized membrane protein YccF (DUF307 family)
MKKNEIICNVTWIVIGSITLGWGFLLIKIILL